jgi:hypothetical protein
MPFAVDEDRMQGKNAESPMIALDPSKPPTRNIPHAEFPRVLYKHPVELFSTILHRNVRHEVVQEEIVPNEHLTMVVDTQAEMDKALASGWVKNPFIPKPLPDPKAGIYDAKPKAK